MQNMIGMLAQSFGIDPNIASMAVNGATKMFLKKSTPKAASGLLTALPRDITDQFDDNDKQKFKTTQDNVNRYDLLKQLSEITGIKDIDKLDNFADVILDNIKQNARIDLTDGLDKEELFQGLTDLSRQQQQSRQF
ncbi:MAG TPA: hypothetical protein VLA74_01530 [Nitrososphaeraceae archaeon]|jgi:hypothetical protein|nr:hypothetical protein [Nitrososphaeraceae archaeon]